jgi:hypothetical protein
MNQNTRWAIKEAFPLRWEADGIGGFGVKLVATTYTYENGNVRERKVFHTFQRSTARCVDLAVRMAGGKLAGPGPDAVYDTWNEEQRQKWQDIKLENPHIVQHV